MARPQAKIQLMVGEQILIVEDTLVNLKLMQFLLNRQGYQVRVALAAEEALEVLRTCHPRLVLTDIQLPGMNGLELPRVIKSSAATRDILVVALSAFAAAGEEQEAFEAGCDGCISKPFDALTLGSRVGEFLKPGVAGATADPIAVPALYDPGPRPLPGRFLEEAYAFALRWKSEIDDRFDPGPAAQTVHQWIGIAGLLGYAEIGGKARALEAALRMRPIDTSELREALEGSIAALAAGLRDQPPSP